MATRVKSNITKVSKAVQKSIRELENTIGITQADVIQLAFKEIRTKGFLRGDQDVNGRYMKYKESAGANQRARPRKSRVGQKGGVRRLNRKPPQAGPLAFHKSKIMDRRGKLPALFKAFRFTRVKSTGKNRILYVGSANHAIIQVKREGRNIIGYYEPTGLYQKVFSVFENSKKRIKITKGTEEKNVAVGRKKVVSNGFRRAVKKFQKFMNGGLKRFGQLTTKELRRL